MKLCFDSIEEVKEFVASLKGTRGKKGEADDAPAAPTTAVPAPMAPPAAAVGFNPGATTGFAPPNSLTGQVPNPAAFPAAVAPEITALVQRIVDKLDAAIASGQPADAALTWLRGQCGPETANYTLDQIKQHGLPKLAQPALENIAKLMAA